MKKVLKKGKRGNRKERLVTYEKMSSLNENSTRIELIQMLIPVGFQAIEKELQSEVSKQAGAGYTRTHPDLKRWGCNEGSVFLGNQIENIMRQVGIYTVRLSYWKNIDQRQRWTGRLCKKSSQS